MYFIVRMQGQRSFAQLGADMGIIEIPQRVSESAVRGQTFSRISKLRTVPDFGGKPPAQAGRPLGLSIAQIPSIFCKARLSVRPTQLQIKVSSPPGLLQPIGVNGTGLFFGEAGVMSDWARRVPPSATKDGGGETTLSFGGAFKSKNYFHFL